MPSQVSAHIQQHTAAAQRGHSRAARRAFTVKAPLLLAAVCALQSACLGRAPDRLTACDQFCAPQSAGARVTVLQPLLAERIRRVADESPSFRNAWEMIQTSGVPVRIGTDQQLHDVLPRWYRGHPTSWAGVTVIATSAGANVSSAVVAVRVDAIAALARQVGVSSSYFLAEIDRVLIHEIYGHLTPALAASDEHGDCPDQLRAGETTPCVKLREDVIAEELADYQRLTTHASSARTADTPHRRD